MILSTCISGAFHLASGVFWFVLDLSSFIGQTLVHHILFISGVINHLYGQIITLFRILYKDTILFFDDLMERLLNCVEFVVENLYNTIYGTLEFFSSTVFCCITILPKLVYGLINYLLSTCLPAAVNIIKAIIIYLWNGILLIESSLWLAVKTILWGIFHCIEKALLLLQYLFNGILTFFVTVFTLILNVVLDIFIPFYNIPYISICKSVLTIYLLYLFIKHFKKLCIFSFIIFTAIYYYFSSLLCKISIRHYILRRNSFNDNGHINEQCKNLPQDKLCVICQEKLKDVVVMPCRHLCLCVPCCQRLISGNNKACPMCRGYIDSVIKVYI